MPAATGLICTIRLPGFPIAPPCASSRLSAVRLWSLVAPGRRHPASSMTLQPVDLGERTDYGALGGGELANVDTNPATRWKPGPAISAPVAVWDVQKRYR